MIKMIDKNRNKEGALKGITMQEVEEELKLKAEECASLSPFERREIDRWAVNYIRQNVQGMGERERLYHHYVELSS